MIFFKPFLQNLPAVWRFGGWHDCARRHLIVLAPMSTMKGRKM